MTPRDQTLEVLQDLLVEVQALREAVVRMDNGSLLTAQETAERLGTSRDWVYENAGQLGVIRLPGGSERPRIRFRMQTVIAALRGAEPEVHPKPIGDMKGSGLLPVRGPSPGRRRGP